jgi:outer membrane receptor protein involved in Fe transport
LTGGASTTYGADAISGVVNFITKQDFSGLDITLQKGITGKGDGASTNLNATLGGNFADNRGNAVLSVGYQQLDPIYQGARKFSNTAIDSFDGTGSGSGTTVPGQFSLTGVGNQQIDPSTGQLVDAYAPYNFNPYNVFQVPYKRWNVYGAAHYNVTDGIQFYMRTLYSHNEISTIVAPSGSFGSSVTIPYSNPYLPTAAREQFCAANGLTTAQCTAAAAATDPNDPAYQTFTTALLRRMPELGNRVDKYTTELFDNRIGFRGDINSHLHFDISGAYGQSKNSHVTSGYALTSHIRQAALATNRTTCLDDSNGCVPIDLFGEEGSITPDQVAFLTAAANISIKTTLAQAHGQINGDLGFSSPFASSPVNFAIGGEYRRYTARQASDALAASGDLGGLGAAPPNIFGAYKVVEAFGELDAPLIEDRPGFQLLDLQAGIRQSHYTVQASSSPSYDTTTWKAGLNWSPIRSITLRGNYQHAVRAPNIDELFAPNQSLLTNLSTDPCAGSAPVGDADLTAVCEAQGAPANLIGHIEDPSAGQANITTGGNLDLKPETSNSYTFGVVLQPTFLPRFSATVDYYNIKVKDAITTATPADLIGACFGNITAASATDPACTVIGRDPLTGQLSGDTTVPGLYAPLSNLGYLKTDGIDLTANYTLPLGSNSLSFNFNGNWTNHSIFQATPTSFKRDCVGYYSVNCASIQPEFSWNLRSTLALGNADFSLLWRHIGAVNQEPDDIANGDGPAYQGEVSVPGTATGTYNFQHISPYDYFDLATQFTVKPHLIFTITVSNLFNRKPPIVGYDIGSTLYNSGNTYPATYDPLGRTFSFSTRLSF